MELSKYRWTLSGVCILSVVQSSDAQPQRERVRFKESHREKDRKNVINFMFE